MEIQTILIDVPSRIHGFTVYNCIDGEPNYVIFLNSRLNDEMQRMAYEHELEHIESNDFNSMLAVGTLERLRHGGK